MVHIVKTVLTLLLAIGSSVCMDFEVAVNDTQDASMDQAKSAEINLPGFGEVDLDRFLFKLPVLPSPALPSLKLPNITLPTVSLPKGLTELPCVSLLSARTGTCKKADECSAGSGIPDGPCALGLGVCCTKPFTCGQTILNNGTIFTSPGYPEPYTGSDICLISIIKSLTTAQIRLDFEAFDIAGTDESGVCSEDSMEVVGVNPGSVVPKICGMNQGQHMYLHVDKTVALSPLLIKFTFSQTKNARLFKIRVTQLPKSHSDLAPDACLQYFTGTTGVVRSFNYEHIKNVGIRTIKGLTYGICFRKEAGFCSVRLDPTFTRVARSAPRSPSHGYYAPRPRVAFYRSHSRPVYLSRPAYLNRPVLVRKPYQPHRMVYRPAVYYPVPPVAPVYYKPVVEEKKKVDLIESKKDELQELLNQKKELIEQLLGKKVVDIKDLVGAEKEKVEALLGKKKEQPVSPVYYPAPYGGKGYYYPTPDKKPDVKEIIVDKKEELDGLLAKKKLLIEELFSGLKVPELPKVQSLDELLKSLKPTTATSLFEKKPVIVDPYGVEKKVTPSIGGSVVGCEGKDIIEVPEGSVCLDNVRPVVLSSEPFAVVVANRGNVAGRGFSFSYTHQTCQ